MPCFQSILMNYFLMGRVHLSYLSIGTLPQQKTFFIFFINISNEFFTQNRPTLNHPWLLLLLLFNVFFFLRSCSFLVPTFGLQINLWLVVRIFYIFRRWIWYLFIYSFIIVIVIQRGRYFRKHPWRFMTDKRTNAVWCANYI